MREPGEFCWFNMLTPRPAEARTFFGSVLGWESNENPFMGYTLSVGGHDIGAMFDVDGAGTPKGTPPHIGVMLLVENADAACKTVRSLGGEAQPPFDIMGTLRMAVCTDPAVAEFDVWEPGKSHGTDVDSHLHGAPSWFELLTFDVAGAARFYSGLFGWRSRAMPKPGGEYTMFDHNGAGVAGMMRIAPEMGFLPPHWGTYFTVRSADDAVREAVKLGATICARLREVPGVGRFCGIVSPQRVMFHVIEYARS